MAKRSSGATNPHTTVAHAVTLPLLRVAGSAAGALQLPGSGDRIDICFAFTPHGFLHLLYRQFFRVSGLGRLHAREPAHLFCRCQRCLRAHDAAQAEAAGLPRRLCELTLTAGGVPVTGTHHWRRNGQTRRQASQTAGVASAAAAAVRPERFRERLGLGRDMRAPLGSYESLHPGCQSKERGKFDLLLTLDQAFVDAFRARLHIRQ